jgi:hypothetical protein
MGLIMSEVTELLAGRLGIPVRVQGALRLIRLQDFERIVDACRSDKLLILGIEAFTLSEGRVIPETDLIADYSELATKHWDVACLKAARSAEAYFDEAKSRTGLWFDFSLRAPR